MHERVGQTELTVSPSPLTVPADHNTRIDHIKI
jgi:hypothetical protein